MSAADSSRHQAVATIGMHELAAVLGLPADVHAVAVQVALNPHGVEVLIEGDSLGEVLDGNEAPLYPRRRYRLTHLPA